MNVSDGRQLCIVTRLLIALLSDGLRRTDERAREREIPDLQLYFPLPLNRLTYPMCSSLGDPFTASENA